MTQERWYTTREVAAFLGVKPDTVGCWIRRKHLLATKFGRDYLITAKAMTQFQQHHPRHFTTRNPSALIGQAGVESEQ